MTDTSALRAFIEARLEEDEQDADGYHRYEGGASVLTCDHVTAAGYDHCTCGHPRRLEREVAAKRAILADLDRARAQAKQHPKDFATTGWMLGMMRALGYLALAWNDHPDFDLSWTSWSTT